MTNRQGTPVWYELMTRNPDAAQVFYGSVLDWHFLKTPGGPQADYRIASAGADTVAGLLPMPGHAEGMPDMWFIYVGVNDVDAVAERVKMLGGTIEMQPTDIPGIGRFAFCCDPQGAYFYLMRGDSDQNSRAFSPDTPGHCSWNELVTTDQTAALGFYRELFGWEHGCAMAMGDAGDYTFINHQGAMIGAMMDLPQSGAQPFWNFAFTVSDIDRAKSAVETGGGQVRLGPIQLPGDGGWLIQATDPNGAKIMFTGRRNH
ncbi:MAG: VOC family protein [Rhodobacteraceae bacterium]|nr:VOC family protein [Paracoccaceae bacterium]